MSSASLTQSERPLARPAALVSNLAPLGQTRRRGLRRLSMIILQRFGAARHPAPPGAVSPCFYPPHGQDCAERHGCEYSPAWIFPRHPEDEITDCLRHTGPSWAAISVNASLPDAFAFTARRRRCSRVKRRRRSPSCSRRARFSSLRYYSIASCWALLIQPATVPKRNCDR